MRKIEKFKDFIRAVYRCVYMFLTKIRKDAVGAYAANAAFFILVSIFPFLILMITVIHTLFPDLDFSFPGLISAFPAKISDFLTTTFSEAENAATGAVLSLAAISTLWAASKGLFALMFGLNTIADTDETRSYFVTRSLAVIYTLGLILTLLLTVILLIFGNTIYSFLLVRLGLPDNSGGIIRFLRYLFGALMLTAFFTILYTFVPNRRSSFIRELPGAICCTGGWIGFSAIYSLYIDRFGNYTIYGSLSAIVLLMLWLYFCMFILLIGAEINKLMRPLYKPIKTAEEKRTERAKRRSMKTASAAVQDSRRV